MVSAKSSFQQLLKENGCSVTKARTAVFDALLDTEPMSMHELVAAVQGIDRASVYRTIDLFERLGIVQRIVTGWKYKIELSDRFTDHHHHLTCTQCGRTVSMNENELETFIDHIAREHGFMPTTHQIEIQGRCQECRASQDQQ